MSFKKNTEELVENTRSKYRLRMGEMIESVVGNDRIKKLFEAIEEDTLEEKPKEKVEKLKENGQAPSGFLAVDLGIVTKDIKNGLLIG